MSFAHERGYRLDSVYMSRGDVLDATQETYELGCRLETLTPRRDARDDCGSTRRGTRARPNLRSHSRCVSRAGEYLDPSPLSERAAAAFAVPASMLARHGHARFEIVDEARPGGVAARCCWRGDEYEWRWKDLDRAAFRRGPEACPPCRTTQRGSPRTSRPTPPPPPTTRRRARLPRRLARALTRRSETRRRRRSRR